MNSHPKSKHHDIKMPKEKLESRISERISKFNSYGIASTNLNLVGIA